MLRPRFARQLLHQPHLRRGFGPGGNANPSRRNLVRQQHTFLRNTKPRATAARTYLSTRTLATKPKPDAINVEDVYEKKTPIEHVLLRPGMYIGSVEHTEQAMWVLDKRGADEDASLVFENRVLKYNPGLYKLFDEILVNAIDNHARDKTTTRIDITLPEAGSKHASFSVRNNGRGIPVQYHSAEKVYVPEMVLGQLLTGSNFADAKVSDAWSTATNGASPA